MDYIADDVFVKCGEVPKERCKVAVQFLDAHMEFSHSAFLGFCQHGCFFGACSRGGDGAGDFSGDKI